MYKKMHELVLSTAMIVLLVSCSSSGGPEPDPIPTDATKSFPSGMVVASPTASGSAVSSSISKSSFTKAVITDNSTFTEKKAVYDAILAAKTDEACQITFPSITLAPNPECYGPELEYRNHPNGADVNCEGLGVPCFPTGDLGIWVENQGEEACAAAKINSLMSMASKYTDYVMLQGASMVCLMTRKGEALPTAVDEEIDLTTDLNTAISVNNTGFTVKSAKITKLADVDEHNVYLYTILLDEERDDGTITFTYNMKHMPTSADNSTFEGRIWAKTEGAGSPGDVDAYSLKYQMEETALKYEILGASYQGATSVLSGT